MAKEIIGVIPAAGKGSRLSPLPGSKELFPIGFDEKLIDGEIRSFPKVICHYLIDQFLHAGIKKILIIISKDKFDIMHYFGDGHHFGVHIAYITVEQTPGMPFSINNAYPWIKGSTIVFGMPDTIFSPDNAYVHLLEQHLKYEDDLTLGIFQTKTPWRFGMVSMDDYNRVTACIDKPDQSKLKYLWGIACWNSRFSKLINEEIHKLTQSPNKEIVLGDFFQLAIEQNYNVHAVPFDDGEYIDIGTPQELKNIVLRTK